MQAIRTQKGVRELNLQIHRSRILLVDEDPGDRDRYYQMLHDNGFKVKACSDFEAGARMLGTVKFDCAVVSQGGPGFEGRLVLEQSMAKDRYRPVVILSRYHDVGCYLEAMQLGAVDYLEKPLSAVEIVRAVTTHLQPRNAAA
ncbi:MAG: response regulator [Acidobacteria bacterium]|nr:MAG: response regulator [Acidobacteriota bacterium]